MNGRNKTDGPPHRLAFSGASEAYRLLGKLQPILAQAQPERLISGFDSRRRKLAALFSLLAKIVCVAHALNDSKADKKGR
jgi:hypothetical protein